MKPITMKGDTNPMSGTRVCFHNDWDPQVLACPVCGCAYLHHQTVFVYGGAEDSVNLDFAIVTADGKLNETGVTPRNGYDWALRRDSIIVSFRCEGCDYLSALQICQHKGVSLVEWKTDPNFDLVRPTNAMNCNKPCAKPRAGRR